MVGELKIRGDDSSLVITARQGRSFVTAVVSALATSAFLAIASHYILGLPTLLLVTVVAIGAGLSFSLAIRSTVNELRMTNRELESQGRCGDRFRSARHIDCADILWLEYQEDTSGPETSYHPGGLYAVLKHHSICILPYVDRQQADTVIGKISERFPELRQRWKAQSPFGQHVTLLPLHEQPRDE